jgi:UDP-N-acetylmuramoyl-tripeptide--D-alanyl-D-alanine ligase
MVANALCAAAVGEHFSMTKEEIKRGIESYKTVGSRSNVIRKETVTIIDDCYNANPTSVKASVNSLSKFEGRRVAIIGDMKELGKNELELHFQTGEHILNAGIDEVIAVGGLCQKLFEGAQGKGFYYKTVDECIDHIKDIIRENDTVLVKASHSMHFDRIVDAINENFE